MAIMMGKLYAALRKADVPDEDAIAAAEEVAAFENRRSKIEGDLNLLKWMVGFSLAMHIATLGLVLRLLSVAH
jgi:hypothetical protein